MWSVWLVFCDYGFHFICPLMDKDMKTSWCESDWLGLWVLNTHTPEYPVRTLCQHSQEQSLVCYLLVFFSFYWPFLNVLHAAFFSNEFVHSCFKILALSFPSGQVAISELSSCVWNVRDWWTDIELKETWYLNTKEDLAVRGELK